MNFAKVNWKQYSKIQAWLPPAEQKRLSGNAFIINLIEILQATTDGLVICYFIIKLSNIFRPYARRIQYAVRHLRWSLLRK